MARPSLSATAIIARAHRLDKIYTHAVDLNPENLGPIAQQTAALIEIGIHGSNPTVERVLDPTQDISTEDRFRFLIGCIGQLNAVALHPARQIDELRAGMAESQGGN
jgi:hypothetical protein